MRAVPLAVVLMGVAARPAPHDPSIGVLVDARARSVPSAHGRCRLQAGPVAHDLRVWLDGDRMHLAVLGPFGTPRLVLRSDGRGVALQQGPETLVAADADTVLQVLGLPRLGEVAGLWVGRLPDAARQSQALPDGRAWAGHALGFRDLALSAIVHPRHGVELIDVGPARGASVVSLSRSATHPGGLPDVVRLHLRDRPMAVATCTWTEGPAPDVAFALDGGQSTPLEELGHRFLAPLLPSLSP